jgi:hypothetical protein
MLDGTYTAHANGRVKRAALQIKTCTYQIKSIDRKMNVGKKRGMK